MKFISKNEGVFINYNIVEKEDKTHHFVELADKTTYENITGFASKELIKNINSFEQGDTVKIIANVKGRFIDYDLEKISSVK